MDQKSLAVESVRRISKTLAEKALPRFHLACSNSTYLTIKKTVEGSPGSGMEVCGYEVRFNQLASIEFWIDDTVPFGLIEPRPGAAPKSDDREEP